MKYLIGADIGTSGTKTVLFDTEGNVRASFSCEYPLYQPQNGWAEQDPRDWVNAAVETIGKITAEVDARDIKGIGISGQMHGLVMLDKDNKILRNSIIWCDGRTAEECKEISDIIGKDRLIEITANPALAGFTASKIMWVKKHEPEIYAKCAHILLPKDYVRFALTGVFATDVSDASGMQLLDVKNRCMSEEILAELGIDKALVADVYESQEVVGHITEEAAKLTGLCAGTPVVAGAGDNASAAVGTGTVKEGKAFTTIGTSGVVYAHTDKPIIDKKGRVHTFCCAVPGKWHVMGVTQAAGLSLRWFKDNFCDTEAAAAQEKNVDVYRITDEEAEESPLGANGLYYLPYLMGERTPHLDTNARGMFFGISAMHTRKDFIRAVLEGVSYSLKDCIEVLKEMNISVSDMTVCGGGSKSMLWREILADVFDLGIKRITSDEGVALGAAILAGCGTGIYPSVEAACEKIMHIKDEYLPHEDEAKKYAERYKIYDSLYPALRDIYAQNSKVTLL